jgi:hypothetical protein
MMVTIANNNSSTDAEISVIDIYGNVKFTLKKNLLQGNNMIEISAEALPHGPYFLKLSTKYGKDSKAFYKL